MVIIDNKCIIGRQYADEENHSNRLQRAAGNRS